MLQASHPPPGSHRAWARRLRSLLLVGAAFFVLGGPAAAVTYTFSHFGSESVNSFGSGINDAGTVVGYDGAFLGRSQAYAASWLNGELIRMPAPGTSVSFASAINNAGQTVGNSIETRSGNFQALLWNGVTPVKLGGLPGDTQTSAYAINEAGQIVGTSTASANSARAHVVVWDRGSIVDLGEAGSPKGINNLGNVVGLRLVDTPFGVGTSATLWDGKTWTTMRDVGGDFPASVANDINDAGHAVGYSNTDGNLFHHATLWHGTTPIDLGDLGGGQESAAFAINNREQIVGYSRLADWDVHAVLWNGTAATDLNSFLDAATVQTGWYMLQAMGIRRRGMASAAMAPAPTTNTSRPQGAVTAKRSGRSNAIDPASATTPASSRIPRRITVTRPGRRRGR